MEIVQCLTRIATHLNKKSMLWDLEITSFLSESEIYEIEPSAISSEPRVNCGSDVYPHRQGPATARSPGQSLYRNGKRMDVTSATGCLLHLLFVQQKQQKNFCGYMLELFTIPYEDRILVYRLMELSSLSLYSMCSSGP